MRFTICILMGISFSHCFAQNAQMGYLYKNRCKDAMPAFAALAAFESQRCLPDTVYANADRNESGRDLIIVDGERCTSKYRIIRVLDSMSDIIKEGYLEVKESRVLPHFRHRPMLIFGNYKDGMLQIEGYEDPREYFDPFNSKDVQIHKQHSIFSLITASSYDLYAFHAIGTPYYNVKNFDNVDTMFYDKYLKPSLKPYVLAAGKDFNALWKRLHHKRTPLTATKIKNDFVALGAVNGIYAIPEAETDLVVLEKSGTQQTPQMRLEPLEKPMRYVLYVAIETVLKNDAKIDLSVIKFQINGDRLPSSLTAGISTARPIYVFGDLEDGRLAIKSLVSPRDVFVFGDMVYDISMGFPFEEFITYLLPPNASLRRIDDGQYKYSQPRERDAYVRSKEYDPWIEELFTFAYLNKTFRCRPSNELTSFVVPLSGWPKNPCICP